MVTVQATKGVVDLLKSLLTEALDSEEFTLNYSDIFTTKVTTLHNIDGDLVLVINSKAYHKCHNQSYSVNWYNDFFFFGSLGAKEVDGVRIGASSYTDYNTPYSEQISSLVESAGWLSGSMRQYDKPPGTYYTVETLAGEKVYVDEGSVKSGCYEPTEFKDLIMALLAAEETKGIVYEVNKKQIAGYKFVFPE